MDEVGSESMFSDRIVVDSSDCREPVGEMFAKLNAEYCSIDFIVFGSGFFRIGFRIAFSLWVKGIDLCHTPAQPDEGTVLGFAHREWSRSIGEK